MSQYLNKTGLETLVTKIKELVNSVQSNLAKSYNELLTRISNAQKDLNDKISNTKSTIDAYTVNGKKISTNPTLTKADVGLGNVANVDAVPKSDIGVTVAPLQSMKIPAQYLPSYVDDIKNFHSSLASATVLTAGVNTVDYVVWVQNTNRFAGYANGKYYNVWASSKDNTGASETWGTVTNTGVTPVSDKIYVQEDTNLIYRWSGTNLVEISKSLALGETSSTAYPGNKGAALNSRFNDLLKRYNAFDEEVHIQYAKMLTVNQNANNGFNLVGQNINGAATAIDLLISVPSSTAKFGAMSYDNLTKLNGIAAGATADSAIPTSEIEALFK